MRSFDKLIADLKRQPQAFFECRAKLKKIKDLAAYDFDTLDEMLANLRVLGISLVELKCNYLALESMFVPIEKQKFCIVDIETNGSKPTSAQIIELGAVMVENGIEIARFETLVRANEVPENITILTGIKQDDLKDAPALKKVLERFRLFLADAVFVAHNVNFDYNFISYSMQEAGFGPLLNPKMCTIDLAKKTIEAPRYGLGFLSEFLKIEGLQHHRALSDAIAAHAVMQMSLKNLPENIITTEDLISFAKPNPKKRKKSKTVARSSDIS